MKAYHFILLAIIIILGGTVFATNTPPSLFSSETKTVSILPSPTPTPEIIYKTPIIIRIPSIDVDTYIESVGLDNESKMDVPQEAMNVGWYNLGFKPGEKGSAVIAGHLDKIDGSPAVFWNLSKIQLGDAINVMDEDGKEFRYVVTDKKEYEAKDVPLQEVFNSTDKARLNLITCAGSYKEKSYSHRTVVYAELVE
jgi:sortase A